MESWIKQGGSHPVLFATHLSHTRKFLHRVQAHQLSFTDPDRDSQGSTTSRQRGTGAEPGASALPQQALERQPHCKLAGKPSPSRETLSSGSFSSPILSNYQHSPCSRVSAGTSVWGGTKTPHAPRRLFRRKKPHFLNPVAFWKGHKGWASWHNKSAFSKKHLKLFLESAS